MSHWSHASLTPLHNYHLGLLETYPLQINYEDPPQMYWSVYARSTSPFFGKFDIAVLLASTIVSLINLFCIATLNIYLRDLWLVEFFYFTPLWKILSSILYFFIVSILSFESRTKFLSWSLTSTCPSPPMDTGLSLSLSNPILYEMA